MNFKITATWISNLNKVIKANIFTVKWFYSEIYKYIPAFFLLQKMDYDMTFAQAKKIRANWQARLEDVHQTSLWWINQ